MASGAFDLLDRPLVFVPVKWPGVAADDKGDAVQVEHRVDVQIDLLDRDEFAEWIAGARRAEQQDADAPDTPEQAAQVRAAIFQRELAQFKRVAKGWRRIVSQGRAVEFTDENIAKLLRWPGFVTAFGQTYMDTWAAELAIREGNSAGSPVNGPAGEPTDATETDGTNPKS